MQVLADDLSIGCIAHVPCHAPRCHMLWWWSPDLPYKHKPLLAFGFIDLIFQKPHLTAMCISCSGKLISLE